MTIDFLFGWADVAVWLIGGAYIVYLVTLVTVPALKKSPTLFIVPIVIAAAAILCALLDVLVNHLRWVP